MTVRLRLTLLYGLLFALACGALIALSHALVAEALDGRPSERSFREGLAEAFADEGVGRPVRPGRPPAVGRFDPGQVPAFDAVLERFQDDTRRDTLDKLLNRSLIAAGVAAVGSFGLAWVLAGRALRPVEAMTETARRISDTNLHERIDVGGADDEIRRLGETFNEMLGRLEVAFESQRRFAADASHELRTPLAVLRARTDNVSTDPDADPTARALAADLGTEIERAERLVDALLALARAEQTVVDAAVVDLAELVGDVVAEVAPGAVAVDLDLVLDDAVVRGDRVLLERLVANAVANAVGHNEPGGSVWVRVGTEAGRVVLRVSNTGAVLGAADVDAMFDRFRRLRAGRLDRGGGHGLGMAIIRTVAERHGGEVTATARPAGGLDLVVSLPAVASTP